MPQLILSLLLNSSLSSDEVRTMAGKYDKTPAQIFFEFLQTQGIMVLSGTKDPVHMLQVTAASQQGM
jgi:diketogulonate reductase-like aldo/keto reductase